MTSKTPESHVPEKMADTTKPESDIETDLPGKDPEKTEVETTSILEQTIRPLLANLLYPSESDEAIDFVTCYLKQESALTVSQIKDWLMLPPSVFVEEVPETEFWEPVTTQENWYGDEEKKRTETFIRLQQVIEEHLTIRQVFRVGEFEIDVYLLGHTTEGKRAGLKTKVVET